MSAFNRRDFLKTLSHGVTAAGVGALAGFSVNCTRKEQQAADKNCAGCPHDCQNAQWTGFRYAMCNESLQEKSWEQQCEIFGKAGYTGVEIAAFTLVENGVSEISAQKRKDMVAAMKNNGLECAGLHWLLAPPPKGLHFTTPDKSVRDKTIAYLNELIDFCGDLGGTVMVFGSPKQRNALDISVDEAKKYFAEGLAAVADHAQERKVKILLETLDSSQTDVVNTMAEALEIIEKINHPAIQTMFDFHNTADEKESFVELLKKYHKNIYHVHVQEMDGQYLGTGDGAIKFVDAFQFLKNIKYCGWVSLEVFDFSPGGEKIAVESFKVLKRIEEKLS
ncbi:TIM barrel protein [candidate division KSB1 bacterium]|nr:TIM barrel protein [candidate division KSB1 bacterium]